MKKVKVCIFSAFNMGTLCFCGGITHARRAAQSLEWFWACSNGNHPSKIRLRRRLLLRADVLRKMKNDGISAFSLDSYEYYRKQM